MSLPTRKEAMPDIRSLPDGADSYAERILTKVIRRELPALDDMTRDLTDEEKKTANELFYQLGMMIHGKVNPKTMRADLRNIEGMLKQRLPSQDGDAQPTLPPIQDASAFVSADIRKPIELIHGVLHKGCKLALGGGSKTFKSWTLIDLALSVSHGQPWLGLKTNRAKVCYLNFELPDWSIHARLREVAHAKEIRIEPGYFHVWNLRGQSAGYKELLPRLTDEISVGELGLIILDPIYKLYGDADENSARDISAMLNEFERLAQTTGAAIAFAAHFSKGNQAGKEAIDRISGSGCFAPDPDAILTFTRHEEENAFSVDATLRNHKILKPFVVQWEFPLMLPKDDLDPAKIKQPIRGGRKQEFTAPMLLESLGKSKLTTAEWQARCEKDGITRATFYRLFKNAQKAGVRCDKTTRKWQVSKVSKPDSDTSDTSQVSEPLGSDTETERENPQS
jgi:hypothetical protein